METFQYQALRNVVKEDGEEVMKNFGRKYRELKVEGTWKKVAEAYYMGTESDARKRFQNNYRRGDFYRQEILTSVEIPKDVGTDQGHHPEDLCMMATSLEGLGMMVMFSLEIVVDRSVEILPTEGLDQKIEERIDVIELHVIKPLSGHLETSLTASDAGVRTASK